MRPSLRAVLPLVLCLAAATPGRAQVDPELYAALRWRCIGPFRGGRTVAAVGVPGRPHLFYIGVNNGGVWRTDDAGRTWEPLFDAQPTQSIGALAVAPSNPDVIYAGSGEGLQRPDLSVGDGVYRSDDAGRTWRNVGLRDGQQVPAIAVDPGDPERVFVAVLGHPYGANAERGVFRSLDGGRTWTRVLHTDDDTGAMDVVLDPADPRIVYATLWAARQAPWEAGWVLPERNGFWRSTDGGEHWQRLGEGLPGAADGLGRIGLGTCASDPARLYAIVGATRGGGLYRSDDRGEHWRLVNADRRLWERDGDFNEVKADPRNADVLYVANVVAWRSADGGRTFAAWRGAPGGDDYHRVWIDPDDARVVLLAGDQGAVVTLNGGRTFSSWYNQPTAQMFHVATDDAFPYRVYGGQQESGSAMVASRGDDGRITARDWRPVGVEEYGYAVPDPLHPEWVFGGKLTRWDRRTGDVKNVAPDPLRREGWRWVRTMPVAFHPADPRVLLLGANVVFETTDGGEHWRTISPDLTRRDYPVPATLGAFAARDEEHGGHRGVVYALAPSPLSPALIWAGTDDGLVHVTHDRGGSWRDVTPPALGPWSKVSVLEASRFDSLTAWAAVNRFRLDDLAPHVWRTRDGGATWTETVAGLPRDVVVNAVREDPVVPGLLYAATERAVFVSFDGGDHWQSLRQNLPATSVRDLVVHGNDLVVGTHGRSFWILDDVSPLRQAAVTRAAKGPWLLRPAPATRVRWNRNTDTPVPPDEPAGENPPDGAVLDYWLPAAARGPVTIEVRDGAGRLVRRVASTDPVRAPETFGQVPGYWMRPERLPGVARGAHRWVWDLHETPPPGERREYGMAAVAHETPAEPRGPWALPGTYRVRLEADGVVREQSLEVRMDPRVPATAAELAAQHTAARRVLDVWLADTAGVGRVQRAHAALGAAPAAARDSLGKALDALAGAGGVPWWMRGPGAAPDYARLASDCARALDLVGDWDGPPTAAVLAGVDALERTLAGLLERTNVLEQAVRAAVRP